MEKLTLFYLEHCPYCRNARKALEELAAESADYARVPIRWIEESREPDLAGQYDYYNVPTVYLAEKKLYEARPGERYADCREALRSALEAALAQ